MKLFVGTSGYAYKQWKGKFYPEKLTDRAMLGFYGARFNSVEINNTFYRIPAEAVLARWCAEVPEDFSFAIKASRRITHQGRLKDVADSVDFLFKRLDAMRDKLGPVLFQLPPNLKLDLSRLQAFLDTLPAACTTAIEFRHTSWFDEAVFAALRRHNVALCLSDGEMVEEMPFVATARWGYLRLRAVDYVDEAIAKWADRVRSQDWSEAYVFFKHEDEATGPMLAERFREVYVTGC